MPVLISRRHLSHARDSPHTQVSQLESFVRVHAVARCGWSISAVCGAHCAGRQVDGRTGWWGIACAVPTVDRNLELRLFDVDLLVLHQLLFERAPDSVWLLQPGVFPNQKLDALVLEVVIHHALVVASYTHAPLLKLAYDSLATLLCNPRDITLRASVLETQTITISHKYITNCIKYWA